MKFVVTKTPYSNEVEVKLHYTTRDRILKSVYWSCVGVIVAVGTRAVVKDNKRIKDLSVEE